MMSFRRSRAGLYPVIVGFLPLVDAALLVIAREEGFAAAEGVDLILAKEGSWAAVRDRLAVGHLDASQMLAPAAIAMNLGLGQPACRLVAPMALNRDGNAITVSRAVAEGLKEQLSRMTHLVSPRRSAIALASLIRARRAAGLPPLTVGTVFGFSCHTYQLGNWLAEAELVLERDVRLVVVPPSLMVEALHAGRLDLFCAGSPWNSLAMAAGAGHVLHPCARIVPDAIEKLLVLPADKAEAAWLRPLVTALRRAASFAADPAHRDRIANLMARPDYLGVPASVIADVLAGRTRTLFPQEPCRWVRIDPAATLLSADAFAPLLGQMAAAGHLPDIIAARDGVADMIAPARDYALLPA